MDLIIICGPPASGKMTVGQELQKLTGYKLFYNHLSLELVNQFFDFGTPNFRNLDRKIRFDIFEAIAKSDIPGLIFTIVWAFDEEEDAEYIEDIIAVFKGRNPKVCLVELDCEQPERLRRNRTENRLAHKPSKRDLEFSDNLLRNEDNTYRMNTLEGEYPEKNILKIENTKKTAVEAAKIIMDHFKL